LWSVMSESRALLRTAAELQTVELEAAMRVNKSEHCL
jgi:hypothetical protein